MAPSEGTGKPWKSVTEAARTLAITALAVVVPTERMSELTPTAAPDSLAAAHLLQAYLAGQAAIEGSEEDG